MSWKYTLYFLLYDATCEGVPEYVKLPSEYFQNVSSFVSIFTGGGKDWKYFSGRKVRLVFSLLFAVIILYQLSLQENMYSSSPQIFFTVNWTNPNE